MGNGKSSWQRIYGEQIRSRSQDYDWHRRAIAELAGIVIATQAKTALDLGSGEPVSAVSEMLASCGLAVTTIDCMSKADVCGTMEALPFRGNAFDLIVSRHSIEHSASPILALYEMRRVAKNVLLIIPEYNDKFVFWRGHFSVFPRGVWEYLFAIAGWQIDGFEEGNFTPPNQKDADVEWRYLLSRSERIWIYEKDGHFLGMLIPNNGGVDDLEKEV